jgi:uncharacterized Tic20 family protein
MLAMFLSAAVWMFSSYLGLVFFFLQFLGYLYLWLSYKYEKVQFLGKLGDIFLYFVMTNFACFIGVYLSIRGQRITTWKKANTTR